MIGNSSTRVDPLVEFKKQLKKELPAILDVDKIDGISAYYWGMSLSSGLSLTLDEVKDCILEARRPPPKLVPYPKEDLNPTGALIRDMTLAWAITHYASPEVFLALCTHVHSNRLLPKSSCLKFIRDLGLTLSLGSLPWLLSEYYQDLEEEHGFPIQCIAPSLVLLNYEGPKIAKTCLKLTQDLFHAAEEFLEQTYFPDECDNEDNELGCRSKI